MGPTFDLPSKIVPISHSPAETSAMMSHGRRDATTVVRSLTETPHEEVERRLKSPDTIFYFIKER